MNSLPKTVTRQRRDCDLNPGPSAPESSTLTTRLPSHPVYSVLYDKLLLTRYNHDDDCGKKLENQFDFDSLGSQQQNNYN